MAPFRVAMALARTGWKRSSNSAAKAPPESNKSDKPSQPSQVIGPDTPPAVPESSARLWRAHSLPELSDSDSSGCGSDTDEEAPAPIAVSATQEPASPPRRPGSSVPALVAQFQAAAHKAATTTLPLRWMTSQTHWEPEPRTPSPPPKTRRKPQLQLVPPSPPRYVPPPPPPSDSGSELSQAPSELSGLLLKPKDSCPAKVEIVASSTGEGAASAAKKLVPAGLVAATIKKFQAELQQSQADYRIAVRALHLKTQECDNLTGVVKELAADRAKSAGGAFMLRERCGHLLADVARLGRVAEMARQGQTVAKAAAAATTAQLQAVTTAKQEAEEEIAAQKRQMEALTAQNASLSHANRELRRKLAIIERTGTSSPARSLRASPWDSASSSRHSIASDGGGCGQVEAQPGSSLSRSGSRNGSTNGSVLQEAARHKSHLSRSSSRSISRTTSNTDSVCSSPLQSVAESVQQLNWHSSEPIAIDRRIAA